jgi:hypothetical protein
VQDRHHPTPEERDERFVIPLPPEVAIEAILKAGPHPNGTNGKSAEVEAPADK